MRIKKVEQNYLSLLKLVQQIQTAIIEAANASTSDNNNNNNQRYLYNSKYFYKTLTTNMPSSISSNENDSPDDIKSIILGNDIEKIYHSLSSYCPKEIEHMFKQINENDHPIRKELLLFYYTLFHHEDHEITHAHRIASAFEILLEKQENFSSHIRNNLYKPQDKKIINTYVDELIDDENMPLMKIKSMFSAHPFSGTLRNNIKLVYFYIEQALVDSTAEQLCSLQNTQNLK